LNPSLHLAKLALRLTSNLQAPEYAEADTVEEVLNSAMGNSSRGLFGRGS